MTWEYLKQIEIENRETRVSLGGQVVGLASSSLFLIFFSISKVYRMLLPFLFFVTVSEYFSQGHLHDRVIMNNDNYPHSF